MEQTDTVLKKMEMGRAHDLDATTRMESKLLKEKISITNDIQNPETKEKSLSEMTKEELTEYKKDLKKRLMYFQTEAFALEVQIKKIMKLLHPTQKAS